MARSSSFLLTLLIALSTVLLSSAFVPTFGVRATRVVSTELPVSIKVDVGDGEPIESALRRFKREVSKSGHLIELRHKRYFENPQEKKKRKIKEGRLRIKFERLQKQRMAKNRT